MGVPLHRIKDVRLLYGEEPWGNSEIDFVSPSCKPMPKGHVIATRITSENPDEVSVTCDLFYLLKFWFVSLCFMSHRQQGHLETAPPCEGREAR